MNHWRSPWNPVATSRKRPSLPTKTVSPNHPGRIVVAPAKRATAYSRGKANNYCDEDDRQSPTLLANKIKKLCA